MAEVAEEAENNSNTEQSTMLGTILPCNASSLLKIKHDFDQINVVQQQQQSPPVPSTVTLATPSSSSSSSSASSTSSSATSASSTVSNLSQSIATIKSPSPSPSTSSGNMQQHPINLKSEDCEKEFCHKLQAKSPSVSSTVVGDLEKDKCSPLEFYSNFSNSSNNNNGKNCLSPQDQIKATSTTTSTVAAALNHLNGTMQDIINLQKLQNLACMEQQQQQHHNQQQHQQQKQQQDQQNSSIPGQLAGLQGLSGISSATSAINSPLNLSLGSTSSNSPKHQTSGTLGGNGAGLVSCSPTSSLQMPQLILASGHLVQGVQSAQLLIPTSQGIALQTILTIPVSQQINANEQFLQNYSNLNNNIGAFNNRSIIPPQMTSAMQQSSNFLNPNLFSNGVQQLLAALHPQLFTAAHLQSESMRSSTHHQQQQQQQQQPSKSSIFSSETHSQQQILNNTNSYHQSSSNPSPKADSSQRETSPLPSSLLRNSPMTSRNSPTNFGRINFNQDKLNSTISTTASSTVNAYSSSSGGGGGGQVFRSHSPNSNITTPSSSHSLSSQMNSPSSISALSSVNRLISSNNELTVTKSYGSSSSSSITPSIATATTTLTSSTSATVCGSNSINAINSSPDPSHNSLNQPIKLSPSSMHISPTGTEASTTDLLVDSPSEPTISQTNCNVVDGIDLDEIKEFAKAFKLRRLSLGLTQTQVGQALSVTEGPAYSQSAICSALAAQMYAAQLSSQQQNMFEKLDITPKSAQKIKPVLERWMKEAEENHWNRYKTGQNHLNDFIGVEPSKKRKRRTSFTPQALELLNAHFERNTHPSGTEITGLAHQLGYEREVIRIWFCNKRQALKNTVRMMSKGMV